MTVDTLSSEDFGGARRPGGTGGRSLPAARATALATAATLVLAGGVVTAALRVSSGSSSAAALIPSTAFAVAELDLDPSSDQADALRTFLDHFPDAPTHHQGSLRDVLLRAALRDSTDPHVDYDKDVRPWLGDRAAVAGWIGSDGKPHVEFLLKAADEATAKSTLARVAPSEGRAFADGYVVLAPSQHEADDAVAAAQKSSLTDATTYHDDLTSLGGAQVMTGWVDAGGVAKALGTIPELHGMTMIPGLSMLAPHGLASLTGRAVFGVHATDRYVEVVGRTLGETTHPAGAPSALMSQLPDGTIAAAEISHPGDLVTGAVNSAMALFGVVAGGSSSVSSSSGTVTPIMPMTPMTPMPLRMLPVPATSARPAAPMQPLMTVSPRPAVTAAPAQQLDPLKQIEQATGLSLPGDAKTLLGSAAVVSYGGLRGSTPAVAVRSRPADLAAARAVAEHVREVVAKSAGMTLGLTSAGNDLVVATSDDYAQAVAQGGELGKGDRFALAMGSVPTDVTFSAYADLADILPLFGHGTASDLDHFDAVGLWAATDAHGQTFQLRLVAR